MLEFMKNHPEQCAMMLVQNGEVVASHRPDAMMNLASTMKVVVAIAYARDVVQGRLHPEEMVSPAALEQFYVPNTDGGAHQAWLNQLEGDGPGISLREVVKGMIIFSSNANTEYMIGQIGLDRIGETMEALGLENHEALQYMVSALMVGKEAFPDLTGKKLVKKLRKMDAETYTTWTKTIHKKLLTDNEGGYRQDPGELSMDVQRNWSDRLPRSTVRDYVKMAGKINQGDVFPETMQQELDEVLGWPMSIPGNSNWLERLGMKGGSTAFVLTKMVYATDKEGNRIELAYFFDDLKFTQNMVLQQKMNDFELAVLRDESFREKIAESLGK